ncbi:ABC transporter permease [Microbacterium sp. ARD32]|uniref:ABC transporter permease n=1 Tax=Microbacterium sp. ARD32 TaxID=2962577 RepID=UPI0028819945|nr:ABC transporter permease [Microbacterium sp. ARD32]MDT0158336.1 ABC transporter permease [Microbacterium sp. ARD32]
MKRAIRVEALKLTRSPVGIVAGLAIVLGLLALLGGISAAVAGGQPELVVKLGPAASADWGGLLSAAAQIMSAGGLLGFGVVLSWMFGREFTDGTITALFALPVGRGRIALAKLVVFLCWAVAVAVASTLGLLALGLLLRYGAPGPDAWVALGRQLALGALTAVSAIPVAWVATATRSLLAGVASAIALVVLAQVGALAGAGGWMPPAAPALWAISGGTAVSAGQLSLTVAVAALFAAVVAVSWSRLQLHR